MRAFPHPNFDGEFQCPICGTSADCPVVLVGIPGTESNGIIEAQQVHEECYSLHMRMDALERAQGRGET